MNREQKIVEFLKSHTSWRVAKDASGKAYYYDKKTRVTQWEKPAELVEFEKSLDPVPDAAPVQQPAPKDETAAAEDEKPNFDREIVDSFFNSLPSSAIDDYPSLVPITEIITKAAAEAVVTEKDSILEEVIISNVKLLVKHHGAAPQEIVNRLASSYSGLPNKVKIVLEWLKFATALETQNPNQAEGNAERLIEDVMADMLRETFQTIRGEHRIMQLSDGSLPQCMTQFTEQSTAAQRAVQQLARKYPEAVMLKKWNEQVENITTSANALPNVDAAVEMILLESECLQPILILLKKVIIEVCIDHSKDGDKQQKHDEADSLIADVCTIAGWSTSVSSELSAALRGMKQVLQSDMNGGEMDGFTKFLQLETIKDESVVMRVSAAFDKVVDRLKEESAKSVSMSDVLLMQSSAQLLKKRGVLNALTALKRCVTDADIQLQRDDRMKGLLTSAMQRGGGMLTDDAVEDLMYMFPIPLNEIIEDCDVEKSSNPLSWYYICHPVLRDWLHDLLLRQQRKGCAMPAGVTCMLSLTDIGDTIIAFLCLFIKNIDSFGDSTSTSLVHPFHSNSSVCKTLSKAMNETKQTCSELSDLLICNGPLELQQERSSVVSNIIKRPVAAPSRYILYWLRHYCQDMLPHLASEALFDAQRSFFHQLLHMIIDSHPSLTLSGFETMKTLMHADQPCYRDSLMELSSMSCYMDTDNMSVLLHIMKKGDSSNVLRYILDNVDHYQKAMVQYILQELPRRLASPLSKPDAGFLIKLLGTDRFKEIISAQNESYSTSERHVLRYLLQYLPKAEVESIVPLTNRSTAVS